MSSFKLTKLLTAATCAWAAATAANAATPTYKYHHAKPLLVVEGSPRPVELSTRALDFSTTNVNSASAPRAVSLLNKGTAALAVGAVVTTGDFSATSSCGATLEPSASCYVNAVFNPKAVGAASGTLSLSVGGTNYSVALTGSGTSAATIVANGNTRQWSTGAYASSCQGYRMPGQGFAYQGATGSGTYRVQPQGQAAVDVFCDMTSDGGGWTLVMRGLGGSPAGWSTTEALNLAQSGAVDAPTGATFKLADATLNTIRGSAGVFRLKSDGQNNKTRFVGAFTYAHTTVVTPSSGNAMITYADPGVSVDALVGTAVYSSSLYMGITDDRHAWQEFFSTNTGEGYWFTGDGTPNQAIFCRGNAASCNMTMWVR